MKLCAYIRYVDAMVRMSLQKYLNHMILFVHGQGNVAFFICHDLQTQFIAGSSTIICSMCWVPGIVLAIFLVKSAGKRMQLDQ